MVLLSWST